MNAKRLSIVLIMALVVGSIGLFVWSNSTDSHKVYASDSKTPADSSSEKPVGIVPGMYAPDFTLENLVGEKVSLSDFKGKYVLLNFWATWCPPCKAEIPDFDRFYQENKDDIAIFGVELGDKKADVQKFIAERQVHYPIVLDLDKQIGSQYRISAIPTTFILNQQGQIIYVAKGGLTYDILQQIKQILLPDAK